MLNLLIPHSEPKSICSGSTRYPARCGSSIVHLLQSINLLGWIKLSIKKMKITLRCTDPACRLIPEFAYRAAEFLAKMPRFTHWVKIELQKNIPTGGRSRWSSSGRCCGHVGCSKLWGLGYSTRQLEEIGAKLAWCYPFASREGLSEHRDEAKLSGNGMKQSPFGWFLFIQISPSVPGWSMRI